jgi:hypothetical protein
MGINTKPSAKISNEITQDSLRKLLLKEIDAIHVPGFYPHDISRKFAQKIAGHGELDSYKTQYDLKRLGMGFVDVGDDPESEKKYHNEAMRAISLIRDMIYPHITPLDHLRLMLEEVWQGGAELEAIKGGKCFVGSCRVIDPGAKMLPHSDRMGRMTESALDMKGQLAVNIYLQMPEKGGEVELWLKEPTPEQEKEMAVRDGLDHDVLGEPTLLVKPDVGDLVIFNSQLIHGVTPGEGGTQRVTMSCFIGYRGDDKPLTYWS